MIAVVVAIAVLVILGFTLWLIYRAVRGIQVRAHNIMFGITVISSIFSYAFFLSMDIPQLVKILISILLGIVLIIIAAYLQRRRQPADEV